MEEKLLQKANLKILSILWQVVQFIGQKIFYCYEFKSSLHFVASGSVFGAKASTVGKSDISLNFVASGSVYGAKASLVD